MAHIDALSAVCVVRLQVLAIFVAIGSGFTKATAWLTATNSKIFKLPDQTGARPAIHSGQ